jgi:hypothetical protein
MSGTAVRYLVLLLLCGAVLPAYAQYGTNYKKNFEWEETTPTPIAVANNFSEANAVILSERQRVKTLWLKSTFLHVYFSKKIRIKFQNQKGISEHSTFGLPHSNDPVYDKKDLPFIGKDSLIGPPFRDVRVVHFAARIIKPDGTIVPAEVASRRYSTEVECFAQASNVLDGMGVASDVRYYNEPRTIFTYTYAVKNLQPGDELELDYEYEVPYEENWYWFNAPRIFFNGVLPKQHFELRFTQNKRLQTILKGTTADSTSQAKRSKTYHWTKTNLPGCIEEYGSKPHLDLEHIIYNLNSNDLRYYQRHSLSGQAIETPYWVHVLRMRESRAIWLQRIARKKLVIDKDSKLFDDFIRTNTSNISDSFPLLKSAHLHNLISDEFDTPPKRNERGKKVKPIEKLGALASSKQITKPSKYNFYVKMLYRLRVPFFTTYFCDNRVAGMSSNYLSPMWNSDFAFTIPNGRNMLYLYPKHERMGYYVNELPFYLEANPALFTSVFRLFSDFVPNPEFIQTPGSDETTNHRSTNVLSKISLAKKRVEFDAKVNLSGQFSTMTRGAYLYDYTNPKANPLYGRKIFDLGKTVDVQSVKFTERSFDYPYRTNLRCVYVSDDLVKLTTEGVYEIDLKGWLNTVFEERFGKAERAQPYYPDFRFKDQFKYYLEFDQDIDLVAADQFSDSINNSYGKYEVSIQKVKDNVVLIELLFHVSSNKVAASDAAEVWTIIDKLRRLSHSKLRVKVTD